MQHKVEITKSLKAVLILFATYSPNEEECFDFLLVPLFGEKLIFLNFIFLLKYLCKMHVFMLTLIKKEVNEDLKG